MATRTVTITVDPALQATERYHRVPFDVGAGDPSVSVRILVQGDGARIDLGCEGPKGWRGWSGGARREFAIEEDAATDGYTPGTLEAGEWSVILGLHRVPAEGAVVTVEISIPSDAEIVPEAKVAPISRLNRGSDRCLPCPEGYSWFAGDFHAHTRHSDGHLSIAELARLGVMSGLDFMAVTDHNTVSHHWRLGKIGAEQGITLIPGQEVTTHRGHANVFGDVGWIDFRQPKQEWVRQSRSRGGIMSLNHPIAEDCAWLDQLEDKPEAVELWHSTWYRNLEDTGILAWYAAYGHDAVILGGSDFHSAAEPIRPGVPTTWVLAKDKSVEGILEGVRAGRTTVTGRYRATPTGGAPELMTCPIMIRTEPEAIQILEGEGCFFIDFQGNRQLVESSSESVVAPLGAYPYFLVDTDQTMVAICK